MYNIWKITGRLLILSLEVFSTSNNNITFTCLAKYVQVLIKVRLNLKINEMIILKYRLLIYYQKLLLYNSSYNTNCNKTFRFWITGLYVQLDPWFYAWIF